MTEAVGAVLGWVFSHEEIDEVRWEAVAGNVGSAIVAQRCGFLWDGIGRIEHVRPGQEDGGWQAVLTRSVYASGLTGEPWPVLT